jgi:hypothetical protein
MMEVLLESYLRKARAFESEAHVILGIHESARSRVVLLDDTYRELGALNLRQDELMRQALRCAENGLFRAAHVMAWAAFMDFLEEKLESDGLHKVRSARPTWKGANMAEMREYVPEMQLVEVCQDVRLCTKNETQALVGLLRKRNECAHPSNYFPELNETLGYLSELLQRISMLQPKTL